MTKYLVDGETLADIADAIREQTGNEDPIQLSNFALQIASIRGDGSVKKYTAELTSSQYGWFTFIDENGEILTKDSKNVPLYATAINDGKYYIGSFVAYESTNRYLFKIYDINNSQSHGYEGASKTLTFDLAYLESSSTSGGGHSYSTSEQVVGTWIDGSTIYERTFELQSQLTVSSSTWTSSGISADGISKIMSVELFGVSNYQGGGLANIQNDVIMLQTTRNSDAYVKELSLRYTKSV